MSPKHPPPTVLVVQRDGALAATYAAWLRRAGFLVTLCGRPPWPDKPCPLLTTGRCALCETADVFVYDPWLYVRPDSSGSAELIRALRRTYPDHPVLLTWGSEGMPAEVRAQETDLVREAPAEPAALVDAVREALAVRRRLGRRRRP